MMNFKRFLGVLEQESHCERRKVGAIIARETRIISTVYNGTPVGLDNRCEDTQGNTKRSVIHAEANAILFAAKHGVALEGTTLYVTTSPCIECAKMIIQSGIRKVGYSEVYKDTTGLDLLTIAGIPCKELE
jgi:dCMP deaminase